MTKKQLAALARTAAEFDDYLGITAGSADGAGQVLHHLRFSPGDVVLGYSRDAVKQFAAGCVVEVFGVELFFGAGQAVQNVVEKLLAFGVLGTGRLCRKMVSLFRIFNIMFL